MGQRILHRRATAAQWTSTNPVLQDGEFGWESDTNRLKIGNGSTAWNALAYFGGGLREGVPLRATLANNISFTQAHGLGVVPKIMQLWLECINANNGYSVGDLTSPIGTTQMVMADAVNVYVSRTSATAATNVMPKGGGNQVVVSASTNWRWYVRSFA